MEAYFDNSATTAPCCEAVKAVTEAMTQSWGNPSSLHAVGNKANELLENSRKKLQKKNLDMICANNLKVEGAGFGVETNVITMITGEDETALPKMTKEEAANEIFTKLLSMRK